MMKIAVIISIIWIVIVVMTYPKWSLKAYYEQCLKEEELKGGE